MREICMSGSTRGQGVARTVAHCPTLLFIRGQKCFPGLLPLVRFQNLLPKPDRLRRNHDVAGLVKYAIRNELAAAGS